MASAEEYARWIVDNADKKGTPEFDTVAKAYQQSRQQAQQIQATHATPAPRPEDSSLAFTSGNINKGIAGLAGMPVDFATNLMNLGIAGYGYGKGKMGGTDLPGVIESPVGGSQWMEQQGRRLGLIDERSTPETIGGRLAAGALQAAPSALVGRPTLGQLPRAMTTAATSGVGSQLGQELAPEDWRQAAGVAGALAPGGRRIPGRMGESAGEAATRARMEQGYAQAKELGVPVRPREMRPDKAQQKLQDSANKELGQPAGTEITPQSLKAYRGQRYDEGYAPVAKALPEITTNTAYLDKIKGYAKEERQMRKAFPHDPSEQDYKFQEVLLDFVQPKFDTKLAIDQIRRMRDSANRTFSSASAKDSDIKLAFIHRKVADAMEGLIEDNLKGIGKPELLASFKSARKQMAQSYALESSLEPITGKINPNKLAALRAELPLTGEFRKMAQAIGAFPEAFQMPRAEELFTHRVTPMAIKEPKAMFAHWLSRLNPSTTGLYQRIFVDPTTQLSGEQEALTRMLIGNRAMPPPYKQE